MARAGHGKNGKFRRNPETAQQDARACDLFAKGYTYRAIAAELGWATPSAASKAIDRAYRNTVQVPADHARRRQLERLDHAHNRVRQILDADHPMVSHGRVMVTEDGFPLFDPTPNLQAAARIESIEGRIARLLGLDAPVKHSVDVVTRDAMAAEMERMAAELEQNDAHNSGAVDAADGLVAVGEGDGPGE